MDLLTKILYQLSLFTSPKLDLYAPARTDCVISPVNYTPVSSICPAPGFLEAEQAFPLPSEIVRLISLLNESDCVTPSCIKSAAYISSNLDETTAPCDDFYQFACGGWMKQSIIPDDKDKISVLSNVQDDFTTKFQIFLENKVAEEEPDFIQLVKRFYQSCMHFNGLKEPSVESLDSKPLEKVLQGLGGWPVVEGENWNYNSSDWLETLIQFREIGFDHNILMSLSVTEDPRNSSDHIIELDQPLLGVDFELMANGLNDSDTKAYYDMMMLAANKLGANVTTSEYELWKALDFEITLANFCTPREQRENVYYTIQDLINIKPQIDWLKFFSGLLNNQIFENETVVVKNVDFVTNFPDFITKADKRVVANYMMWRVVKESLPRLSLSWRNIQKNSEETRWKYCLSTVKKSLGIALASYYLQHYFDETSQASALNIFDSVKQEVLNMLENTDWLDEGTKRQIKEKVNGITTYFQYPKELLNDTYVSDFYAGLTFSNESYFEKEMIVKKWSTDVSFSRLRKSSDTEEWKKRIRSIDFNPLGNSNGFPHLFSHPLFNRDRPAYLNFGAIGSIIGQEIAHVFDERGWRFDINDNNPKWEGTEITLWSKETYKIFKEKTCCFLDQYKHFITDNGMRVNAFNTERENVADNIGPKAAYMAYQSWMTRNLKERKLPGRKYTHDQLFWISAANVYCEISTPRRLQAEIKYGLYSPGKFRVIGPMSNIPEFSEAFNCSSDSAMNRRNKCEVW